MNKYEKLYESVPTKDEIQRIKKEFSEGSNATSWEECYWASKCVVQYDTDDLDAKSMVRMLNYALKYGLTYKNAKNYYLDVIKMLAGFYALAGQHDLVLNCLGSVLELDENAPDWVYHDLVSAQNRTSAIKRNLKRPKMFLQDLAHNDGNLTETRNKQINIYKDFLASAVVYISENENAEVDFAMLKKEAENYGVLNSKEWIAFMRACDGDIPNAIKDELSIEKGSNLKDKEDAERRPSLISKDRPFIISLFPEEENEQANVQNEMQEKYEELLANLARTQKELEDRTRELKDAGGKIEILCKVKDELEVTVKRLQTDMNDYDKELSLKDEEIKKLSKNLMSAKENSKEKRNLESQLMVAQEQKNEMEAQILGIKQALADSKTKNEQASEQITKALSENQELKVALEKAKKEAQGLFKNKAAEITGHCKSFEYILTGKLAEWLTQNLRSTNDWWEKNVIGVLSTEQCLKAQEGRYSDLTEFDLAALLRIFTKNWMVIRRNRFMTQSDKDTVYEMINVRNRLAHTNVTPMVKEMVLGDLDTMSAMLSLINADKESKDVARYAVEISKMKIE